MSTLGEPRSKASAVTRVSDALAAMASSDRPEAWISIRSESDLLAEAESVDSRCARGEELPLAGWTLAVKDNIDVAGLPTTAGCPAFAFDPHADAPVVARLRAAGAIVLGKTSLDQFATGLVGTRSPWGEVRDVRDPRLVSGGSSSGSAVAVAQGIADIGLATDTAGSGRVPAAFQGIVGLKPSRTVLPIDGVVPACRSFDCVSLLARALEPARLALGVAAELPWWDDAPLAAASPARLATFPRETLTELSPEYERAFAAARERLRTSGVTVVEIDPTPFLAAGSLLYEGAFVAERYAAVGQFIEQHPDEVDPAVAAIVMSARATSAAAYLADAVRLERHRRSALALLEPFDALLLPTAPWQPTIDAVQDAPIELNRKLGSYVTFCNLVGLCAVSLPAGEAGGHQFGVSLYGIERRDTALTELAGRLAPVLDSRHPEPAAPPRGTLPGAVELMVVGAHMNGMPLNHELTDRGGRLLADVTTAADYRLFRLDTEPPKPGLVRAAGGEPGGEVRGELWALPATGLSSLLGSLPEPMALGPVTLADGSVVVGFTCAPSAITGATEITEHGGWRGYLESR